MKEREIFDAALAIADPVERDVFLDRACNGDPGLKEHLRGLLEMEQKLGRFLEASDSPPTMDIDSPRIAEGPGTVIGPYKLREQIGEGGMGVVYVAEQTQPVRRKVALKIIKPGMDTRQVIARFEAERQALAMMDHPNIARVHDGGATKSGRPYFVMELVRGIPITDYCDRERLSIPERLDLFVQVCRAVQHAHQKGIIHRDLKPSNILVTIIDGASVPKIIDFGVAKATGASLTERTVYTAFHQFVGTPLYMSPEQADLSGMDMDTRSDIYSLGVLLYELLTGTTPFDQDTFRRAAFDELRRIIREQEPPRPSTRLSSLGATRATVSANRKADVRHLDRAVRGELDWIVMKALEKDRRRRYETASDFAADVMRYLTDQPVQACPPSARYRLGKFARRNRMALVTSTLVATALMLGTVVSTSMAVRATRAERSARQERNAATAARDAEGRARKRAEEAEKTARVEADKATAINDFLVKDLLVQSGDLGKDDDSLVWSEPGRAAAGRITLREALDRAAEKVGVRFRGLPLVEAALRSTLSDIYHGLAAETQTRKQAAAALAIYEREKGPETAETLNAVRRLGHALRDEGKFVEAEPLLRRSLEGLRHVLGEGHPDTLKAMHDLAGLYLDRGKPAEAEPLLAKAVEASPKDPRLFSVLGRTRYLVGHSEAALEAYQKAMPLPWYNTEDRIILALIHGRRGDIDLARDYYLQAAGNRLDTSPHLRALLAEAEAVVGPFDARAFLERDLESRRRALGPNHPDLGLAKLRLGHYLAGQGEWEQAVALFEEICFTGPDRRELADPSPWYDLIVATLRKGDVAGFRRLRALALRQFEANGTPLSAEQVARSHMPLPEPDVDPNRPLALSRRAVGAEGHRIDWWVTTLGASEYRAGNYQAALQLLRPSRATYQHAFCWVQALLFRSMALHRLGRADEARPALAEAERYIEAYQRGDEIGAMTRWSDWLEWSVCLFVHREAVATIRGADFPADPFQPAPDAGGSATGALRK
jgi:non-specific serine/threonine protein kinase/serine/threonine-protein kinase